jgi:hypothetical protein
MKHTIQSSIALALVSTGLSLSSPALAGNTSNEVQNQTQQNSDTGRFNLKVKMGYSYNNTNTHDTCPGCTENSGPVVVGRTLEIGTKMVGIELETWRIPVVAANSSVTELVFLPLEFNTSSSSIGDGFGHFSGKDGKDLPILGVKGALLKFDHSNPKMGQFTVEGSIVQFNYDRLRGITEWSALEVGPHYNIKLESEKMEAEMNFGVEVGYGGVHFNRGDAVFATYAPQIEDNVIGPTVKAVAAIAGKTNWIGFAAKADAKERFPIGKAGQLIDPSTEVNVRGELSAFVTGDGLKPESMHHEIGLQVDGLLDQLSPGRVIFGTSDWYQSISGNVFYRAQF